MPWGKVERKFGNKFYFASQTIGFLACYEISDNGDVKKDWEANYTVPKYETVPSFSWKRDNQQGFYDIQVNNEWLFFLLVGKFTVVGDSIFAVGLEQIIKFNWKKELK